jgi:hypothetical protein
MMETLSEHLGALLMALFDGLSFFLIQSIGIRLDA